MSPNRAVVETMGIQVGTACAIVIACAIAGCTRDSVSGEGSGRETEAATRGGGPGSEDGSAESGTITPGEAGTGADDIYDRLLEIEGATVVERESKLDGYRYFEIELVQPVDHDSPAGATFGQRVTLHHRNRDAPVVLATTGYDLPNGQYANELTRLLGANQIFVEHRYFTPSVPRTPDWSDLSIEQAAGDHHRIVEALRPIYVRGAWVSSGASKGGMTSIYHRRFYPDDVDATVAYVAPLSTSTTDARYPEFLQQVGDEACRQAILQAQREVLVRRPMMLEYLADFANTAGVSYAFSGLDVVLEVAATDLSFYFWQYRGQDSCAAVPGPDSSDAELFAFFEEFGSPRSYADSEIIEYEPYFWQALSQLGAPAPITGLGDLLIYDYADFDLLPTIEQGPQHDPESMADIATWVASEGQRILFVYGEFDPWSAGAFETGSCDDCYRFFVPAGTHSAKIAQLTAADGLAARDALTRWAGVQLVRSGLAGSPTSPPERAHRMLRP